MASAALKIGQNTRLDVPRSTCTAAAVRCHDRSGAARHSSTPMMKARPCASMKPMPACGALPMILACAPTEKKMPSTSVQKPAVDATSKKTALARRRRRRIDVVMTYLQRWRVERACSARKPQMADRRARCSVLHCGARRLRGLRLEVRLLGEVALDRGDVDARSAKPDMAIRAQQIERRLRHLRARELYLVGGIGRDRVHVDEFFEVAEPSRAERGLSDQEQVELGVVELLKQALSRGRKSGV